MYRQITLNKETFVGPFNVCFQEEDGIWKSITKKVFKRSTDPVSSGNDDMKLENKCSFWENRLCVGWGQSYRYGWRYKDMAEATRIWLRLHVYGWRYTDMAVSTRIWLVLHGYSWYYMDMAGGTCIWLVLNVWLMLHWYGWCNTCMAYATRIWLVLHIYGWCYMDIPGATRI